MSFEQTDVDSLTEKFNATFSKPAFGDVTVSLPGNEVSLKSTNCHQEDNPKYGDCYIFDYQKFTDNERLARPGSEKDVERLKHDFRNLNFNVHDFLNLTCKQTEDELKKAAKNASKESKCFVCCFLTHGKKGSLLMKNRYIEIDDILKYFSRSACKNLAGKPKIFIFQACRGCCCEEGVPCDSTDGDNVIEIPDELDFLLVYSTYEGNYSFKTKSKKKENNHGSYFIDELCRTLEKFSDQLDLLQILTIVNYRVAHFFLSYTEDKETDKKKQMPCFTSRLRTEVKFNGKIPVFSTDDTKYFDMKRNFSSLGRKSTENQLEDKQTYKIQSSKAINFLLLLNTENKFGAQLTDWATNLWTNIAVRGYKREEVKDWSKDNLLNYLKIVAARDFSNTDCFICFVACQAKGDDLYDKEKKDFHMQKIVEEFTGKVCRGLRGKPKIFIFLMTPPPEESSSSTESTDGGNYYNMIPVHSDLLEVAIIIRESCQLVGVMEKFCNIFGRKSSENLLSQLTKMNDELVKDYGFSCLLDKNPATFCLKSTLTETVILNKPKCKT